MNTSRRILTKFQQLACCFLHKETCRLLGSEEVTEKRLITAKKHIPTKLCKVNNDAWVEFTGDMWVTLEKYFTKSICEPSLFTNMYIHLNVHQTSLLPPWFITGKLNWWIKKQKHGTISLFDLYVRMSNYWLFSHLLRFIHQSVYTLYNHMIYNMYLCKK